MDAVAPGNANGKYAPGVINVVYFYTDGGVIPTEPTDPPTEPTDPPTEPTEPTDDPTGILIGDVDMDGQITIGDATIIQRHLAELTALTGDALIAADCDGDGRVAIKDVTLILKKNAEYTDEIGRVGRRVAR